MPIYEYSCQDHGEFELIRNISESGLLGRCPDCDVGCRRILSAPHISGMTKAAFVAHETNERSRHEPRVSKHGHVHGPGCSHGTSHGAKKNGSSKSGLKRYAGARPWVVEHG